MNHSPQIIKGLKIKFPTGTISSGSPQTKEKKTGQKICAKCKVKKDLTEFLVDERYSSGRQSWCRVCHSRAVKEFADKKRKKYLEIQRRAQKTFDNVHPLRQKIYNIVVAKYGSKHFGICAYCKKERKLRLHHEDYGKPLEVIPLCNKCHIKIHNEIKD